MKTGKSLTELAQEMDRRSGLKKDFVADTREMDLQVVGENENQKMIVGLDGQGFFEPTEHTSRQIAARAGIPWNYYNKVMADSPELLKTNVRHWWDNKPEKRMIRTMDTTARAFLSDRYKRVENEQVAQIALEAMSQQDDAVVLSADVTDNKLYMKFLFPSIEGEVKAGDTMRAGVMVSNSEIGAGSLNVQAFTYRDFCTNGMVFGGRDMFGFKRVHRGGRVIEGVDYQVLSDEAVQASDEALMLEVRDTVKAAASQELFDKMMAQMKSAADSSQIIQPEKGIELLGQDFGLTDSERSRALINLIEDRDYSKWGALNAVTKLANTAESYDRATELETIGGQILQMPLRQWEKVAVAS